MSRPNYLITLLGGKTGIGATVCASNLAAALYRETKAKVLLIDLDLLNPNDLALYMGAKQLRPIIELLPVAHKLHEKSVEGYITKHKAGFWLLPAVNDLRQVAQLDIERFTQLLKLLKKSFTYVIVDGGAHLTAVNLQVLRHSSALLLLITPEIPVLQQAQSMLRDLITLQYPQEQIHLLCNQHDEEGAITDTVIENKLKKTILARLPKAPDEVPQSILQHMPLVVESPRSPFAKACEQLTRTIIANGMLTAADDLPLQSGNLPLIGFGQELGPMSNGGTPAYMQSVSDLEYDRISDLKMKVHAQLIEMLNLKGINTAELAARPEKLAELKEQVRDTVAKIVQDQPGIQSIAEKQQIHKEVLDEALGLGPLEDILAEPKVSEIMVNRKDQIYVEMNGKLTLTKARFTSDRHLLAVIERIIAPIGRRIDEKTPMVDARLKDGSRVHAIIPPLSIQGPMLTIRKFGQNVVIVQDLVKLGALTDEMAQFLKACVEARLNIVISGGTGTGKTTLLNILSSFIPSDERIITIEDAAELKLPQEHIGRLEARPANLQGDGAIPIRELVRNSLRMRPDRIIIGECRGAEALDMLQAMNTGHDGSLTTLHSNTPRDCIARMETLVMFSGMDLPSRAIREQIASAIDLIIQLNRFSDGSRKITHLTEITGMEGDQLTMQNIFQFKQKGIDSKGKVKGHFTATGLVPSFMDRFKEKGIEISADLFGQINSGSEDDRE